MLILRVVINQRSRKKEILSKKLWVKKQNEEFKEMRF